MREHRFSLWRGRGPASLLRICLGAAALLAAMALPASASAQQHQLVPDPPPQEVLDRFADCPELPADVVGTVCLNLKAYDGELKLGKQVARVEDPIEVRVAIGLGPGLSPVILPAEAGGAPTPINLAGGITGIPQLDPVLATADPLGLIRVTATPELDEPTVGRPGQNPQAAGFFFLPYAAGAISGEPPVDGVPWMNPALYDAQGRSGLGLPLSIKLNNLLFGDNCRIGTDEDPLVINLTNGTTQPPAGVEPLTGEVGQGFTTIYGHGFGSTAYGGVRGSRWVDNGFAVPGATKCDLLPREIHDGLDGTTRQLGGLFRNLGIQANPNNLIGRKGGLFNNPVNQMAGLPSPAGNNLASFKIDTDSISYHAIHP